MPRKRNLYRPFAAVEPRSLLPAGALILLLTAGAAGAQDLVCTECHDVDPDAFAETAHGFLECTDCHLEAEEVPHAEGVGQVDCGICHDDAVEEFASSVHGSIDVAGAAGLTGCQGCHGPIHEMMSRDDPASPIYPVRLPETCGQCHADPEMAERFELRLARPVDAYEHSVHARAVAQGMHAASCSSCHGSHAIYPAADPRSNVNRRHVADTCGQCHTDIAETYRKSIHGQAAAAGVTDSPVCTDCHGEHQILAPSEHGSPVHVSNIPKLTCGHCHGDLRLAQKYGLDGEKVPTYEDSYHGLASRSGSVTVAHCGSCHGIHDILPSSDPRSHIHPDNLPETCGQCHPGAGATFAIGPVHVLADEREHPVIYWVRWIYLWLIYGTIGFMLVHNGLDFFRKARHQRRHPPDLLRQPPPAEERERMILGFRVAHALLALSFIVLAYTGFVLKYPEAWWAQPLLQWEESLGLRGWVHRIAAVVMLASAVVHAAHLATNRQARRCIRSFVPNLGDWHELKHRVEYFVGRRSDPPPAPWVGYPEKMEYLAVIWGTVVMALTGFLLWFENLALRWLPKWTTDLATVIHFYEAVLASLAILVWHFYFVIFDPAVYPMDTAWLTGRSAPGRQLERMEGAEEAREDPWKPTTPGR